jgi:hypothetical protein
VRQLRSVADALLGAVDIVSAPHELSAALSRSGWSRDPWAETAAARVQLVVGHQVTAEGWIRAVESDDATLAAALDPAVAPSPDRPISQPRFRRPWLAARPEAPGTARGSS